MVSEAVERVLAKLPDARRSGSSWQARCPAHEDRNPSLSIAQGDDGRALLKCHAGCTAEEIVRSLGLTLADLMPDRAGGNGDSRSFTNGKGKEAKVYASAQEAIAVLERRHGKRSADWTYHDADGQPVGMVIRWDKGDGKDIRPVSYDAVKRGWCIRGMAEPRPLYRLPEVMQATRTVYVCEGEKAAEAARSTGLTATTSPHGSKSARKADWSPLAGRDVIILPDNDEAGEKYAADVTACLLKLTPRPTVRVVRLPGLPPRGDMADFLEMHHGDSEAARKHVETMVSRSEPVNPDIEVEEDESPSTTPSQVIEPFVPFPVDALPETVASFVREGAAAMGCDSSFLALPLLVAYASAIGNTRRIRLKKSWTEPAILWGAMIGESGSMKSPALELAMRPLRDWQHRKMREHAEAMKQWEADFKRYQAELKAWERDAKKNTNSASDPPAEPERPICKRAWTDDATIEALAMLLQQNPRGMLVIRDELAGWLHFDRYTSASGSKGSEAAKWLEMFGGRALVVDRKTSGTTYVPQAAVSLVGGIQPGILRRAMGQEHRDSGMMARLLLIMPPRRAKRWSEADVTSESLEAQKRIFEALRNLEPALDEDGEPRPALVFLANDATRVWIDFYNEHNDQQADLTGELAAAWAKLEGYAPRFALVHHLVRQAAGEEVGQDIDARSMTAGITLSRWFAHEAERVYAMLGEDEQSATRRHLVALIERRGGQVTVRDWQRSRSKKTAKEAKAELEELISAGLGRWEDSTPGTDGGRPSRLFVLESPAESRPAPEAAKEPAGMLAVGGDAEWGEL